MHMQMHIHKSYHPVVLYLTDTSSMSNHHYLRHRSSWVCQDERFCEQVEHTDTGLYDFKYDDWF